MKTPEDEAFDDLAKRQGAWGGGFPAKRAMAADKLQETVSFPCCGYTDAIKWNQFNGIVQCHMCGQVYTVAQPAQEPEREALKLALEALEGLNNTNSYWWQEVDEQTINKIEPAITTIKEALAQPAQEPVAWAVQGCAKMWRGEFAEIDAKAEAKRIGGTCVAYALYTTPPKRPWVGLTDEEIRQMCGSVPSMKEVVREAETKLKDKNT
jgi:hypothetical protein